MSIQDVSNFKYNLRIADLVLTTIDLTNVIGTGILGGTILKQLLESLEVVQLNLFFNEDRHSELLGNNDFIGRNSRITGNNTSSQFTGLFSHNLATNGAFLATKESLKSLLRTLTIVILTCINIVIVNGLQETTVSVVELRVILVHPIE